MTILTVSLPDTLAAFVERRVGNGAFATADDYVRALIQRDSVAEGERKLASLLEAGITSETVPADDAFWSEMRAAARGQR